MSSAIPLEDDRTARARIRDAAIECFADRGVDGTPIKVIAEAAGVSPGLVIHHFRSKAGLRQACDRYVVATITAQKTAAMRQGAQMDLMGALRESAEGPPTLRYLARTLADGSPEVVALIDDMVEASVTLLEEGVRSGMLRPTARPRELAAVLVLWSFGTVVLHEHALRLLGVDLTGPPEARAPYMIAAIEALRGLLTDEAYDQLQRALAAHESGAADDAPHDMDDPRDDGRNEKEHDHG